MVTTLALAAHLVLAQAPASAKVVQVVGHVELLAGTSALPLERFTDVPVGVTIVTFEDGRASLRLASGTLVRLGSNTRVEMTMLTRGDPAAERKESLKVTVGKLWAKVTRLFGAESRFEVQTDNAVAGVRGTAFFVETNGKNDQFVVDHGALTISGAAGTLNLDGPGAAGGVHDGTLSLTDTLTGAQLTEMRADIGGGAANLLSDLAGPGLGAHEVFRTTLVGPDDPVDDLQPASRAADSLKPGAVITVRVTVPGL